MKTITIDDTKIEISDESYEAFKKQFVTKDKAILWRPKKGEMYWYVDENLGVAEVRWGDYYLTDNSNLPMGNIYKTEEEAEEALKTGWIAKRKAEVEILRFIAENDLEWEFTEDNNNYHICWHTQNSFDIGRWSTIKQTTMPVFKSKQDAQKVIDAMTPQLKILFGVRG